MSFSGPVRFDMLALLYAQHQNYTAQLGQTRQKLRKQYRKMSKVERVLSERQVRHLSREERKKWQYSRVLAKRSIADMESQQARLHDILRQCSDLIESFEHGAAYNSPMTPWGGSLASGTTDLSAAQLPPSPLLFTPFSPIVFSPYQTHRPSFGGGGVSSPESRQPQYWDLSMLAEPPQERRLSSPYATGSSADSGFYEPHACLIGVGGVGLGLNEYSHAADARGQHELMSPLAPEFVFPGDVHSNHDSIPDTTSGTADRDEMPDVCLSPPTRGAPGMKSSHKRCHSENAIHPEAAPMPSLVAKRGTSVGPAPSTRRITGSSEETKTNKDH